MALAQSQDPLISCPNSRVETKPLAPFVLGHRIQELSISEHWDIHIEPLNTDTDALRMKLMLEVGQ